LFVTGPGVADTFWLMGNYYGISDRYCTYLQGIVSKVSNGTAVNFRPGALENSPNRNPINWAIDDSIGSEYLIVVMGNNSNLEGEEGEAIDSDTKGDRTSISLPECQMEFLRRICQSRRELNKSGVIVVLTGGSPVDVREIESLADAVVLAWYPGQEGGYALAELIFGDENFSGRLPVTFPADGSKLPAFEDYSMQNRTYKYMSDNIFYPFGYGLNYSKIEYSNVSVVWNNNLTATVKVSVTNNSAIKTTETVQVYVSAPGAGKDAPLQQLAAFKRVDLNANATAEVSFTIDAAQLKTVEADGSSKLRKGVYKFAIGGAAPSNRTKELGVSVVEKEVTIK
ncbi:MAG: glycoside hydrolase family 3 C-terminal domain-containing protein, partial [Bacteroidales bacterium]|nr:glycoside hydrolase family 3 C-terminal domain-containing protein [Bacteroidales bacterium]